jgi:recombination protein RecT
VTETTDTTQLRGELEKASAPKGTQNVLALIDRNAPELDKLLGPSLSVEQFKTAALTYLRLNPKLYECEPMSVVGGLRLGAQLGLALGPLGHFYLVPFKGEATFILGYKGMIELAYRSGNVKRIEANVVREGDAFDFRLGSRAFLDFTPSGPPGEREWRAVYALAETKQGGKPFTVLYPEQVERRKARSAAAQSSYSPWQTDTEAMWRKTAVRALQAFLPQTEQLAQAVEQDDAPVIDGELIEDGA